MRCLSQAIRQVLMFWCTLSLWTTGLPAQTQSEIVGVGYDFQNEFAIAAPGQVITLRVKRLNVPYAKATSIPLPTKLSGIEVRVTAPTPNYPERLPIFSIISSDPSGCCALTYITVEIPTEPVCVSSGGLANQCGSFGPNTIQLTVVVDGNPGPGFPVSITGSQPHIVNACDTIVELGGI